MLASTNFTGASGSVNLPPPATSTGDYNGDGTVDAADYVVWRKNPGGIYTQNDFNTWRAHFGHTVGSGSGAGANTTVPEPSSLVMLVVTAAGVSTRWRWSTFRLSNFVYA